TFQTVSIRELVEKVAAMTGVPFSDLVTVSEDRLGKDQAYLLDSKKIRDELGWSSKVDLDQGLAQTLAWVDANLEVLKTLPADYIHKP
ncbi:MAG: dTDP-glucose 4,6-dehydratase, partial [Betaproteobacteria bacterium]|nr:dTDP-glucose 4,6-dehydratase [Betaproteobacteria bacterium]